MDFLQKTDSYNKMIVADKCKKKNLFKEQAYLLIKLGKIKEATAVLIQGAGNDL